MFFFKKFFAGPGGGGIIHYFFFFWPVEISEKIEKNWVAQMYQCTKMYHRCTRKTIIFDDPPGRPNLKVFFLASPGSAVVYPVDIF